MRVSETDQGFVFKIFVQPRASRMGIAGRHGDALKVRVTAPPIEGEANRMCLKYLAKMLHLPLSAVEIVSGHGGRNKQILVRCPTDGQETEIRLQLKKRILALLEKE